MLTDDDSWRLLGIVDDAKAVERPPGFDRASVAERFEVLVLDLNGSFNCTCLVDAFPSVQDASFYGDVIVPTEATESGGQIMIRISNFGFLAVYDIEGLWAHSREESHVLMNLSDRNRVEDALLKSGHVAVPSDLLEAPYDGPNDFGETNVPNARPPSWSVRCFGYV